MDNFVRTTKQGRRPRLDPRSRVILALVVLVSLGIVVTPLDAQVIQLPSWRVFSIQTSALVPDQGAVMLGGVNHTRWTQGAYGPPLLPGPFWGHAPYRASFRGTSFATVSAQVLDLQAMDQAVLAEARQRRSLPAQPLAIGPAAAQPIVRDPQAVWLEANVLKLDEDPAGQLSVAEWRLRNEAEQQAVIERRRDEVAQLVQHGDACRDRGELRVAAMFYRRALRQAAPEVAVHLEARLEQLKQLANEVATQPNQTKLTIRNGVAEESDNP